MVHAGARPLFLSPSVSVTACAGGRLAGDASERRRGRSPDDCSSRMAIVRAAERDECAGGKVQARISPSPADPRPLDPRESTSEPREPRQMKATVAERSAGPRQLARSAAAQGSALHKQQARRRGPSALLLLELPGRRLYEREHESVLGRRDGRCRPGARSRREAELLPALARSDAHRP
jgi:hypothetical protein